MLQGFKHPICACSQEPVLAGDLRKDVVDKHCLHLVIVHVLFEKDGCYCADDVQNAVFLASVESRTLGNLHGEDHCARGQNYACYRRQRRSVGLRLLMRQSPRIHLEFIEKTY